MWLESTDFSENDPIPVANAFCAPDAVNHATFSTNRSVHLRWGDVPQGTKSFALTMIDVDVPTVGDDVNQEGRTVRSDLPRTDFVHWLLVDIDGTTIELNAGDYSTEVTARGKAGRTGRPKEGVNDYTGWFTGDPDMEGLYKGYDGPCPPWNDEIIHHYVFTLVALDQETLDLPEDFTVADVKRAIDGHALAEAKLTGTYTLNRTLLRD